MNVVLYALLETFLAKVLETSVYKPPGNAIDIVGSLPKLQLASVLVARPSAKSLEIQKLDVWSDIFKTRQKFLNYHIFNIQSIVIAGILKITIKKIFWLKSYSSESIFVDCFILKLYARRAGSLARDTRRIICICWRILLGAMHEDSNHSKESLTKRTSHPGYCLWLSFSDAHPSLFYNKAVQFLDLNSWARLRLKQFCSSVYFIQ